MTAGILQEKKEKSPFKPPELLVESVFLPRTTKPAERTPLSCLVKPGTQPPRDVLDPVLADVAPHRVHVGCLTWWGGPLVSRVGNKRSPAAGLSPTPPFFPPLFLRRHCLTQTLAFACAATAGADGLESGSSGGEAWSRGGKAPDKWRATLAVD